MHETVIEVTFVRLSDLMVSGAGSVEAASVSGKELDIDCSGAGSVRIGRLSVTSLDVDITGAGSLTAAGQASRQEIEILRGPAATAASASPAATSRLTLS